MRWFATHNIISIPLLLFHVQINVCELSCRYFITYTYMASIVHTCTCSCCIIFSDIILENSGVVSRRLFLIFHLFIWRTLSGGQGALYPAHQGHPGQGGAQCGDGAAVRSAAGRRGHPPLGRAHLQSHHAQRVALQLGQVSACGGHTLNCMWGLTKVQLQSFWYNKSYEMFIIKHRQFNQQYNALFCRGWVDYSLRHATGDSFTARCVSKNCSKKHTMTNKRI